MAAPLGCRMVWAGAAAYRSMPMVIDARTASASTATLMRYAYAEYVHAATNPIPSYLLYCDSLHSLLLSWLWLALALVHHTACVTCLECRYCPPFCRRVALYLPGIKHVPATTRLRSSHGRPIYASRHGYPILPLTVRQTYSCRRASPRPSTSR